MSRPTRIHETATVISLQPISTTCLMCGQTARVAYHTQRRITTLQGRFCLSLTVRRCHQEACPRYHHPYRPEEEGRWALPYGEYGLDVIALVGMLRYRHHHSLAELHQAVCDRGIAIGERTVLNLLARYEELVSIHLANQERLHDILSHQNMPFWRSMGCVQMSVMKCCGSCVMWCLEKFCLPVPYSANAKLIWRS